MSSHAVRAVGPEDLSLCVHVIRESFRTVAEEFGFTPENAPRFTAFAVDENRLSLQLADPSREMYACFDEKNRIRGYFSLWRMDGGVCELNNLCVLPENRHQGIGQQLLERAFQRGRELGCGKIKIGIVEENQRLKRWYQRFGFLAVGTEKLDFFPFTCGYMEKRL